MFNSRPRPYHSWCSLLIGRRAGDGLFCRQWLLVMTLAVLYNLILIVGRTVFWELQTVAGGVWFALDYLCDGLYITDMIIKAHECML